ncbi:hypothetical protein NPJ88_007025 [Halomonas elongata]|uniref:hypothetical protein n=1 Tax=Halomonas elongata TaxID=2746 RepID=UPI00255ACC52|nr:hypothetical protein [Halomonas elongata]MDL4862079.1 hypothetical protein [Halomonas elongata]
MNMLHAIASMLNATARDWQVPEHLVPPPPQPIPGAQGGSVRRHQRSAAKRRSRRRARQLKHF